MVIWSIYTAFTSFISPIWLTMIYLQLSGKIYQSDYSFDEGTAGIIGILSLFMWLIFVLTSDALYLLKMKSYGSKFLWVGLGIIAGAAVICCCLCEWNLVRFLTSPMWTLLCID